MGTEFVFIMVALAAAVNANVGDECDMHELSNACGESRGFICVEKEDDSDKGTCQCRVGYKESNGSCVGIHRHHAIMTDTPVSSTNSSHGQEVYRSPKPTTSEAGSTNVHPATPAVMIFTFLLAALALLLAIIVVIVVKRTRLARLREMRMRGQLAAVQEAGPDDFDDSFLHNRS